MKLTLQPHKRNKYPIAGILIKGNTPLVWLQNLQELDIALTTCVCYPIPSTVANELYGCLVVVPVNTIKKDHAHLQVQLYEEKVFIPEYAIISPFLSKEEGNKILGIDYHFLHPELGLIELEEAIDWATLLNPFRKINVRLKTPHSGVFIPKQLRSVHVEYDEETLLEALENPLTEEEKLEKLPFDMKKLMAGNQKEMEKFLAFMDKNPELAMKYAIPLDTLGTARGNNNGVFQFGGSFKESFSRFFGFSDVSGNPTTKNSSEKVSKIISLILLTVGVLFVFYIIKTFINYSVTSSKNLPTNYLGSSSGNNVILVLFIVICIGGIFRLMLLSKFDFKGKPATINKLIMVLLLIISLYYLLSFMYSNFGLTKWYSIVTLLFIVALIYRLFDVDKEVFKEKDEK
ncbi:hypothetical protein FIA58_008680 [Flavobacterium jejuense]|uniref:MoxR-vWA-beta-propeller ternary system domain-containing protein n=1 Tax=Flavobacterium jejuense TaxID=1544455 RepID=A0ABX0IPJ1_9FLAO|nr:hypothetical protein [Flavobacterium jejuense]NHN25747.1 hypothetical protein [Flavobacterium jejuense]